MSKIATALITNMSSFGVSCMQKGNKQGTALLEKLCEFLNDDPDVMAACKTFPSKWATVKTGFGQKRVQSLMKASK